MKEPTNNEKLSSFLSTLWHADRTLAHRAYAAYFITTYDAELQRHIEQRVSESGANLETQRWAKKTQALLAKYEKAPKGYAYNPKNGSLETLYAAPPRTLRLSGRAKSSLTFDSPRTLVRLAGYLMAIAGAIITLTLGYFAMRAINELGESWVLQIESALEP